ncbi:MAG: M3 family metallopeptidase [Puniceicoccales bacterium]|jgi:oligopeptidase A|nr:M3 family metallopeptidase [Puniceicoccales bacterium]
MAHPFLAQDFLISWSKLATSHIEADISRALDNAAQAVEAVATTAREKLSFASTVLALEDATRELNHAWGKVEHLNSVCNTPAFRESYSRMLPRVSAFSTSVTLNPRLWGTLKAFADTPEAAALSGTARRMLDETLADFAENGAELQGQDRTRLEQINASLATLTQKYSENVLDATNAWTKTVTDPALLNGLPPNALAAANTTHSENTQSEKQPAWRFTLHAPSITPVLQYANSEAFRRECWEALARVGADAPWDNTEIAWQILKLRQEKARLLGKNCFADHTTARRMVRTSANALRFTEDMHQRISTHFARETAELEAFRATHTGLNGHLAPWETAYWAEKQRREKYDLDHEALRPYLPIGGVIDGMFALFGKLFGIRITQRDITHTDPTTHVTTTRHATAAQRSDNEPVEVWHPEVNFYEVHDTAKGHHLGSFYTDWHPRATKRGGAWMNFLHTGHRLNDGTSTPHLGLMCGNFTPGIAGAEPLLSHDEALTIFHEFGHLLHHILSEVPYESLAGTRVAWDFVELPSQLLENWCWQRESLALFARHHLTHQPIPDNLLGKLIRAANYRAATATMRQLALGKLDLELHTHLEQLQGCDLDTLWNDTFASYQPPLAAPVPSIARRFTHIFGEPTGYAAGYYSYKWAEVLEADVFTRFQKEGLFNETTGRELREKILSKGNAEAPEKLFHDFMGRAPDPEALLRREGLT